MHEPKLTYLDNPMAPDIFADGFAGVQTAHGLLRITLASWRHDYSKVALLPDKVFDGADMNCVCIGRLVMTPVAAKRMTVRSELSICACCCDANHAGRRRPLR